MRFLTLLKKNIASEGRALDRGILYSALLLMFFGLFLTFAAGPVVAERRHLEWSYFVYKHLMFMPIGIFILIATALLPVAYARRLGFLTFLGAIGGMILVVLIGTKFQGAARWINIAGISLQPSEFMKPALAIVCAWFLARSRLIRASHGAWYAWGAFGLSFILLALQPDFGMMLTITAIFGTELILYGMSKKIITLLAGVGACLIPAAYFTFDHVRNRIQNFFSQDLEKSYQVKQSLETLKTAGWFGKGPGEGVVKYTVPDAHTDFILSVSAEEFGFLLTSVILLTFMYIVIKGMKLIRQNNNFFVQIAVGGLVAQITFQALVNIGSTLNLLPTKGMTLPLISYGGSSLVSMAFAFGLILALTKQQTFSRGLE